MYPYRDNMQDGQLEIESAKIGEWFWAERPAKIDINLTEEEGVGASVLAHRQPWLGLPFA